MQVVEKFISINGEGPRAGEPAVFIRFKGCNLRCSYCDTMWANEADCAYTEESPEEILAYILASGIKNVTLTGGEPLLQREMQALLALLLEKTEKGTLRVEIETNGAVPIAPFCGKRRPVFTMDYKAPSSGGEQGMRMENFAYLLPEDSVKFVCGSREDLNRAGEIIREQNLISRCHVYFSPVFGRLEPVEIVNYILENRLNDVRIQIQMHKVIWDPEKRGV